MGRPGSGKSYLAAALAQDLGVPHLDIASQPGHLTDPALAWQSLRAQMSEPAIVESAGTSAWERGFWRGIETLIIVCSAADDVRRERIQARPEARSEPAYVRRMLAIPQPVELGLPWSSSEPIPGPRYDALIADVQRFLTDTRFIGA